MEPIKSNCYDCNQEFISIHPSEIDCILLSVGTPIIEVDCPSCKKINVIHFNKDTWEVTTSAKS
jgi:phage FluMu protein Com